MPDSGIIRKILRSWWTWAGAGVVLVVGYIVWPTAVEVARHYDKYRITIPLMIEDYQRWRNAKAPEPTQKAEAPQPPAPPPKKTETPKPVPPCIANASAMMDMLKAAGGDKYARQFDVYFRDKETCFVLKLVAAGTLRMEFATKTWLNPTPTYFVTPRDKADLQRFRPGDLLRIRGRLVRYVDVPGREPDEIYIEGATFVRIVAEDFETGSIRR